MAASVSSSPVAMCISSHAGHFCDAGEGGLEVSSNSPPQPRSFIHRLEIIECSFLPTGNVTVSFGTKHVLWACLHAFFFILSAQWNVHGWASQSLQPNQESPKKSLEDWGRRKHVRGFFSTAPMQKCPLLLAMMMVRWRKAGGWSYSLPGTLSGSWGAWGEQEKVGHFVHQHRWCQGGLYLMLGHQVQLCHFQDCSISNIIPLWILLTRISLTIVVLVVLVLLAVRVHTEPG